MISIVCKTRDFVVINKPVGVPSQSDPSGDIDAMSACSQMLSELGEKNTKLYLIHRLDRVVGGLMVFARNHGAAAKLSSSVAEREMIKEYFAVLEGDLADEGTLCDYIYKDARLGKAFVTPKSRNGVKYAELSYNLLERVNLDGKTLSLVKVRLNTGRFHQIRVQFSSRKMPLVGDKKYGSRDTKSKIPALFATGLEFSIDGKDESFFVAPEIENYPWNLFAKKNFENKGAL